MAAFVSKETLETVVDKIVTDEYMFDNIFEDHMYLYKLYGIVKCEKHFFKNIGTFKINSQCTYCKTKCSSIVVLSCLNCTKFHEVCTYCETLCQ